DQSRQRNREAGGLPRGAVPSLRQPRLLPGNLVEVPLTHGRVALIDLVDLPLITGHCWWAENRDRVWYARAWIGGREVYMHRLLIPHSRVDHRNSNGLDNRRSNLRSATNTQNRWNSRVQRRNTTGFKGVALHTSGRF